MDDMASGVSTSSTSMEQFVKLDIKVSTVLHEIPADVLLQDVQRLLMECGCRLEADGAPGSLQIANSVRAPYEDPVIEFVGSVSVDMSDGRRQQSTESDTVSSLDPNRRRFQAARKLAMNEWCQRTGFGLSQQLRLEIVSRDAYFLRAAPAHIAIPLTVICFGNFLNSGTFLAHAHMQTENNLDRRAQTTHVQDYRVKTAWVDFEHDSKQLTIKFALRFTPTDANDGDRRSNEPLRTRRIGEMVPFKIVVNYNSIRAVVVDSCIPTGVEAEMRRPRGNDEENPLPFLVYLKLRNPPQIWEGLHSRTDINRNNHTKLNWRPYIDRTSDWVRVRKLPANFTSPGYDSSSFADCDVLSFGVMTKSDAAGVERRPSVSGRGFHEQSSGDVNCTTRDPRDVMYEVISRLKMKVTPLIQFARVRIELCDHIAAFAGYPSSFECLSFRAHYALQALSQRGHAVTDQLMGVGGSGGVAKRFYDFVLYAFRTDSLALEEALEQLLAAVDEGKDISLLSALHFLYGVRCEEHQKEREGLQFERFGPELPKYCRLIRKVMVMTTRVLFLPPEVQMENRVVARFGEEYALRCVFRDDDGSRLVQSKFGNGRGRDSELMFDIVGLALHDGISIKDRVYKFLAWSNSQMRDHGTYMFCSVPVERWVDGEKRQEFMGVDGIRHWMGDFTATENVPKLMSRMGQCFTQTQKSIVLRPEDWVMEADVEGGRLSPDKGEPYCFSDGIGLMSMATAVEVAQLLEIQPVPSAYQVRFKGFKGMLCVDPTLDSERQRLKVVFRKSQRKFLDPGDSSVHLEIVKYAMPSPVYLNRPFINIVDQVAENQGVDVHRKIKKRVHGLLENLHFSMADMLCRENDCAEMLYERLPLKVDFRRLRLNGFELTKEPYFRSLALAIHRYNIKMELYKAKVEVPPHLGRTMYGVMDETGILQYGQVFVQYSKSLKAAGKEKIIRTGRVLMTKNPCLVPGDVRVFDAIDVPALHHLNDVVVFPRYGPRPHTDEMAGSDLDGDEYSVFWDPELLFDRNEEPIDFPSITAVSTGAEATANDMIAFFMKYMNQDSIGVLSTAHLVASERFGIFDERCNDIAKKCSIAVDFPKSGTPADGLSNEERPYKYPDYLQKPFKPPFRSRRLCGQIFRKSKLVEDVVDLGQSSVKVNYFDEDLCCSSTELDVLNSVVVSAMVTRDRYNSQIQALLDTYGITDEASLVSGHMVNIRNRICESEKENFSFFNTEKAVELQYACLAKKYREEFFREFGAEEDFCTMNAEGERELNVFPDRMIAKAKLWYMVVYHPQFNDASGFRSFAWLLWEALAYIKRNKVYGGSVQHQARDPVRETLTDVIDQFCQSRENQVEELRQRYMEHETIGWYLATYKELDRLCFVLINWAAGEKLFELGSVLLEEHLLLLFIEFGLGRFDICLQPNASRGRTRYLGEEVLDGPATDSQPSARLDLSSTKGPFLFDFLRFAASQQLMDQSRIVLKRKNALPLRLNHGHWTGFVQIAFKTYNSIALTACFDALRISTTETNATDWDLVDMDSVTIEMPTDANFIDHVAENAELLKEWTGMTDVCIRPHPRLQELYFVSAVGSITAKHRLQWLLTHPELPDCFVNRRPPLRPIGTEWLQGEYN